MKIDFVSHTAMGGDFVVGSHHLATALASSGHDVRHVSAPVTPAHLLMLGDGFVRRRFARFLRGGAQFAHVDDIVPFAPLPWALARSNATLRNVHARAMLSSPFRGIGALRLRDADFLVVDEPRLAGLAIREPRPTLAYRATDLYAAMRGDPTIIEAERLICQHADLLVATSDKIAAHLRQLTGRQAHVLPNGVDFAHFSTRATSTAFAKLPGVRARRAVYVGAFDARFGVDAVAQAARALPGHEVVLAGPGGEGVRDRLELPNVHAIGAVPYEKLPALLQSCAVGLLPFSADAANAGRSPMKLFEYSAAGLAVAATATFIPGPAAPPALALAPGEEFGRAVEQAFALSQDGALIASGRAAARAQDWNAKAAELLRLLQAARAESTTRQSTLDPLLSVRNSWN